MTITHARFTNPEHTQIAVIAAGEFRFVPADDRNTLYQALVASGVTIETYVAPVPTADDVRAECRRRMMALLAARDAAHLDILISNGTREAVRLLNKQRLGGALTDDEAARAAQLAASDQAIEALRAASNAFETDPPDDFADDRNWLRGHV